MTEDDVEILKQLEETDVSDFPEDTVNIFLTNAHVHALNSSKMDLLPDKVVFMSKVTKRDTHTNIVPIAITEENIYKTGGLPSNVTLAKGAKAMITKNVDTADHLVNGSIGTIEEICVDMKRTTDGTIYLKFDDANVGKEAQKESPAHLKHCVPIKSTTSRFLLTSQCPVQIERTMYLVVPAFTITAHKSQDGTYNHVIGDLTLPGKMKQVMEGQAYTILSSATSRKGLKLVGFSPSKVRVNKAALTEMDVIRDWSDFSWKHPLQALSVDRSIWFGFLNIPSLKAHFNDLKTETFLQPLAALCLTETRVSKPANFLMEGFDSFWNYIEHGLAMHIKDQSLPFQTRHPHALQLMTRVINKTKPILLVVTYKPPKMP